MELKINEGIRPSQLELGRYATGELSAEEAAAVEARLDERAHAWLAAVDAGAAEVPDFDAQALRARAAQVSVAPAEPLPAPANRRWMRAVAVIAAIFLAVLIATMPSDPAIDPDYLAPRGEAGLQLHRLQGDTLHAYQGQPVGEGDVLGFKVDGTGHRSVVLLSVDGDGQVSVFWPETGDAPEPLSGAGMRPLPGSLTLDNAPGPEIFIAVFDVASASEARDAARRAWMSGGGEGLMAWSRQADHVEAVSVMRR